MADRLLVEKTDDEIIEYLKGLKALFNLTEDFDIEDFIFKFGQLINFPIANYNNLDLKGEFSRVVFGFIPFFLILKDFQVLAIADSVLGQEILNEIDKLTTVKGVSFRGHIDLAIRAARESTFA